MEKEPKESMDKNEKDTEQENLNDDENISDKDTEQENLDDDESKSGNDAELENPNDDENKSAKDAEQKNPNDDESKNDNVTESKAIISDKKTLLLVSGFGLVLVALAFVLGWMLGASSTDGSRGQQSLTGGDDYAVVGDDTSDSLHIVSPPEAAPIDFVDFAVATVDGVDINASDINFLLLYAEHVLMDEYFTMFPDDWEIDYDKELREGVTFGRAIREEAVRVAAMTVIQTQYAEQLGITLSVDDMQMIDSHIQSFIDHHGETEFNNMLLMDGINGHAHLARIIEADMLIENLYNAIMEDPNEFAKFEQYMAEEEERDEELLAAKHILVTFNDFDSEEEAEEFAETLRERALAGEDFDALIAEYGQDPGMVSNPDGYTFVEGVMAQEFEQATRELEIGEISEPVKTSHGLHIIMRIEPDEDNVRRPWGSEVMTPEGRMMEAIFTGFEAMVERAQIVFLPQLDEVEVGQQ